MNLSRRDTIILAVLINAALLSILFFTATRPHDAVLDTATIQPKPIQQPLSGFSASRMDSDEKHEPFARSVTPLQSESIQPVVPQQLFESHFASDVALADEGETRHTPVPQPNEEFVEVIVKRGDFLEKIARANGTTVAEVKRINQLNSDRIDIGQVVLVPAIRRPARPVLHRQEVIQRQEAVDAAAEYYVMKPGDNPWNIARQHQVNLDEFLRLNNLDEERARNLKPGDRLRVR